LWYSNVVTTRLKNEQTNHIKKWAETVKKKADLVKLTNQTFEQLKTEEERKVKLYAKAIKEIEKDLPDFDMALYIISDNNIPLILTDDKNNYLTSANISLEKKYFIEKLQSNFQNIRFNGESENLEKSLYTVLNVSFPPSKIKDMLLFSLDINQISVSGGSACSSGSNVGSHVLAALKVEPERASVRFSFSKYNTFEEIDYTIGKLVQLFEPQLVQK